MVQQSEVVAEVEGPNGKAEVVEVPVDRGVEYEVVYKGQRERFKSMGEAYITAKEKAGVK
jgi:hypothetical protein